MQAKQKYEDAVKVKIDTCRLLFVRVPTGNYAAACNPEKGVQIYGPGLTRIVDPSQEICYRGSYKADKLAITVSNVNTSDQMSVNANATIYFRIVSPYDAMNSFLEQEIQPSAINETIKQYMEEELKTQVATIILDNNENEQYLRDLSLIGHSNELKRRISSRAEFKPSPRAGYDLLLISQEEFIQRENKASAMLIKDSDNHYSLWGWKKGEWQLTQFKDFDASIIPGEWENNKKISVHADTSLFNELKADHQQPFIEILDVDIQLKPSNLKVAEQLENAEVNVVLRKKKDEISMLKERNKLLEKEILLKKEPIETAQKKIKSTLDKMKSEIATLKTTREKKNEVLSQDKSARQTYQTLKKESGITPEVVHEHLRQFRCS